MRKTGHYTVFVVIERYFVLNRNTATHTVEQELLFVGQEAGKLLAVRDIVQKVRGFVTVYWKDNITVINLQCFPSVLFTSMCSLLIVNINLPVVFIPRARYPDAL